MLAWTGPGLQLPSQAPPVTWQPPKRGPIGDPPPSWREVATKQAILDFVQRVTAEGGADAAPPQERVAVFDNDGILWCE